MIDAKEIEMTLLSMADERQAQQMLRFLKPERENMAMVINSWDLGILRCVWLSKRPGKRPGYRKLRNW